MLDGSFIDVGVTAVKYDRELFFPSEQEVQIAIDAQRARTSPPNEEAFVRW